MDTSSIKIIATMTSFFQRFQRQTGTPVNHDMAAFVNDFEDTADGDMGFAIVPDDMEFATAPDTMGFATALDNMHTDSSAHVFLAPPIDVSPLSKTSY